MEPLWSPVVATGGTRSRIESRRKRREQAKTVAVGCDQLPGRAQGKEGVNGSSPDEAPQKPRTRGCFRPKRARGSHLIELFASERTSRAHEACSMKTSRHPGATAADLGLP